MANTRGYLRQGPLRLLVAGVLMSQKPKMNARGSLSSLGYQQREHGFGKEECWRMKRDLLLPVVGTN